MAKTYNQELKDMRKTLNYTLMEMSEVGGVHYSLISRYENFKLPLYAKVYNRVLSAIGEPLVDEEDGREVVIEPPYEPPYPTPIAPPIPDVEHPAQRVVISEVIAFLTSIQDMVDELVHLRGIEDKYNAIKEENDLILNIINKARKDTLLPESRPQFKLDPSTNSYERVN